MESNANVPKKLVLYYSKDGKIAAIDNTAGIRIQEKKLEELLYSGEDILGELESIPNLQVEKVYLSGIDD